jgi:hypothetical protein
VGNLESEEKRFNDGLRWVNWLEKFESEIESKNQYTDEEKREFLNGVVDRIVVHFDNESNQHSLEIDFNLPIVSDSLNYNNPERHSEGWSVEDGHNRYLVERLPVSKGGRPSLSAVV